MKYFWKLLIFQRFEIWIIGFYFCYFWSRWFSDLIWFFFCLFCLFGMVKLILGLSRRTCVFEEGPNFLRPVTQKFILSLGRCIRTWKVKFFCFKWKSYPANDWQEQESYVAARGLAINSLFSDLVIKCLNTILELPGMGRKSHYGEGHQQSTHFSIKCTNDFKQNATQENNLFSSLFFHAFVQGDIRVF